MLLWPLFRHQLVLRLRQKKVDDSEARWKISVFAVPTGSALSGKSSAAVSPGQTVLGWGRDVKPEAGPRKPLVLSAFGRALDLQGLQKCFSVHILNGTDAKYV